MERGSSKHGSRLDDALAGETEAMQRGAPVEPRVEEFRNMEPESNGEPGTDSRPTTPEPPPAEGTLTPAEIEAHSELARHLSPGSFPGDRAHLIDWVETNAGPPHIVAQLRTLPEDRTYDNVQEVWSALGGREEHRS